MLLKCVNFRGLVILQGNHSGSATVSLSEKTAEKVKVRVQSVWFLMSVGPLRIFLDFDGTVRRGKRQRGSNCPSLQRPWAQRRSPAESHTSGLGGTIKHRKQHFWYVTIPPGSPSAHTVNADGALFRGPRTGTWTQTGRRLGSRPPPNRRARILSPSITTPPTERARRWDPGGLPGAPSSGSCSPASPLP